MDKSPGLRRVVSLLLFSVSMFEGITPDADDLASASGFYLVRLGLADYVLPLDGSRMGEMCGPVQLEDFVNTILSLPPVQVRRVSLGPSSRYSIFRSRFSSKTS
jgi:hypothetical protein